MKSSLLFLIAVLSSFLSFSQNENDYGAEINRRASIPNSPEAGAFSSYGNIPVDLRVGKPSVSVPLYTYKGKEFDLPISLSYDMDARKVNQVATNVGMGWNLNLGGRISRILNEKADKYEKTGAGAHYYTFYNNPFNPQITSIKDEYFDYKDIMYEHNADEDTQLHVFGSPGEATDYFDFLHKVQRGEYDISLDSYSVNVMGINDRVFMNFEGNDHDIVPTLINNSRYIIEEDYNDDYSDNWRLIDDQGNQYIFEKKEKTESSHTLDVGDFLALKIEYVSSWLLTKIISANGKDVYDFEYTGFDFWEDNVKLLETQMIGHWLNYPNNMVEDEINTYQRYRAEQQVLTEVKHNGNVIIDIATKSREDLNLDSAIASISIINPMDANDIINHYEFVHSYFGDEPEEKDKRLKLDEIKIAGHTYDDDPSNYVFEMKYSFDYESSGSMPPRDSKAQDVFGFYNGEDNNSVIYPRWVTDDYTFTGANRDFSPTSSKVGILTKIHYPAGGFTEFKYEQHSETEIQIVIGESNIENIVALNHDDHWDSNQCGPTCMDTAPFMQEKKVQFVEFEIESGEQGDHKIIFGNTSDALQNKGYIVGPLDGNSYTYEDILHPLIDVPIVYQTNVDNAPLGEEIYLAIGEYYLMVVNSDEDEICTSSGGEYCTAVSLNLKKITTSQQNVTVNYAGLRVASIENYTDASTKATMKTFTYDELSKNFDTKLTYTTLKGVISPSGFTTNFHRLAKAPVGDEPYISYGTVTEKIVNPSNLSLNYGKTVHTFSNSSAERAGNFIEITPPFLTTYYENREKGNLKRRSVYNDLDEELSRYSVEFSPITQAVTISGQSVTDHPEMAAHYIKLYWTDDTHTEIKFRYVPGNGIGPIYLDPTQYPNHHSYLTGESYSRMKPIEILRYMSDDFTYIQNTSRKYYDGNEVTTETTTTFDPTINYLTRSSEKSTSEDNKTIITSFKYPEDLTNDSQMDDLIDVNRVATVIETKTTEDINGSKTLLSTQKSLYKDWEEFQV